MTPDERRELRINLQCILLLVMLSLFLSSCSLVVSIAKGGERVPTTSDAVGWALADVATLPDIDRPFARYLWIPPWGRDTWVAGVNFAINSTASHARTIVTPRVLANGWLVAYDLRRLAPDPQRLAKLLATWDGLATDDPYFHVPAVNTGIRAAVIAPHLDERQAVALAGLSLSTGAIYRADWFLSRAMTTIDGGRYYDFRQVARKPEKGSGLDNWLSERGLFVGTTQAVGGERRAAMFRSGVTAKPRRIDLFPTLAGGLGSITRDVKDGNVRADSHPIRNLLDFRDDGSEVIVALPNGLLDYLLADAQGNIVDEAPPDLVRDHTIPPPHTARLAPMVSCARCHNTQTDEGWRVVTNDVERLLGSRLNVFADVGSGLTAEQAADKLAGLYGLPIESADGMLGRGRRDFAAAVARTASGIKFDATKSIVAEVSSVATGIFDAYTFDLVPPTQAALELGWRAAQDDKLAPLDAVAGVPDAGLAVDPVEGFLRLGVSINRTDFEAIYADLAARARAYREGE